jgi:acyl-CoA thioester hydrolase
MARIKIDLPSEFLFSCEIPIRITDLNYGNHVGNDALLGLIHEARVQFLKHYGQTNELDVFGVGLIMGDVGIQFASEVFYGTSVVVEIAASDFASRSFDLYYKLTDLTTNQLIAKAKTGMVCFDYETRKSVAIPQQILDHWAKAV